MSERDSNIPKDAMMQNNDKNNVIWLKVQVQSQNEILKSKYNNDSDSEQLPWLVKFFMKLVLLVSLFCVDQEIRWLYCNK